ncbi:D-2-hydroxyacid dehydrogenase [Stakelama pacifica]|uniref:Phosphoglycerate dehydrogenase-like enzyme n=1 Tax=Stakelama pacifica TaxID=517720 RepID=A0A4R6FG05_9SPHN|nr:D-2-hydroxyacid dehydrogenase [Stakelama pacifica]TDN80222.1 phosphoglycerate dehydrogenase-like enzyme [Stakelama pacifica]GGO97691.1 hydroxyacid dehydrogenase [Stakelama pacifica]
MKALLPAIARPLIGEQLPDTIDAIWFDTPEMAEREIGDADIAWVDMQGAAASARVAAQGERLQWLFTMRAGVDDFDTGLLRERGTVLTNGIGLHRAAVAEYTLMGMLVAAKRFDEVLHLADDHQWSTQPPGTTLLEGSSALIMGYGDIGRAIGKRLEAFDVKVTGVTRSGSEGTLRPDEWRERLGEFDWVILAAPATDETSAMIGEDEFTAMKKSAWLINVARGSMVDQAALLTALRKRRIGGAFLDTVTPEPLPSGDPLWSEHNAILSLHLAGRSDAGMFQRAARLFLDNLRAFMEGREMTNVVDLAAGY